MPLLFPYSGPAAWSELGGPVRLRECCFWWTCFDDPALIPEITLTPPASALSATLVASSNPLINDFLLVRGLFSHTVILRTTGRVGGDLVTPAQNTIFPVSGVAQLGVHYTVVRRSCENRDRPLAATGGRPDYRHAQFLSDPIYAPDLRVERRD